MQPLRQPADLGRLAGALAALEGHEDPAAGQPAAGGGVPAQRGHDVGEHRHGRPSSICRKAMHAGEDGEQPGDEQHHPLAVTETLTEPRSSVVPAEQPDPEQARGQRDDQDQPGPGDWTKAKTRPAHLVVDLAAQQGEAGQVGHAGARTPDDHEQQRQRQVKAQASNSTTAPAPTMLMPNSRRRDRSRAMLGPEPDAQRQADEDRAEQHAERGVAAAERSAKNWPVPITDAAGRERAEDADDQAADQRGLPDELPALGASCRTARPGRPARSPAGAPAADPKAGTR